MEARYWLNLQSEYDALAIESYLMSHSTEKLAAAEVLRRGWVAVSRACATCSLNTVSLSACHPDVPSYDLSSLNKIFYGSSVE